MEHKKKDKQSRFKLALNCTPLPSWWGQTPPKTMKFYFLIGLKRPRFVPAKKKLHPIPLPET